MTRLGHVALATESPHELARFYCEVLELELVRVVETPQSGKAAMLRGVSDEDHELVLLANPDAKHVALRVEHFIDLHRLHDQCAAAGAPIMLAQDRGGAVAFFIRDPDGNIVEIYWPTGRPWAQPVPYQFD